MPLRVCAEPGCPTLVTTGRCAHHRSTNERARGTRQQRGYDAEHDRLRAEWAPRVATGTIHCARGTCRRLIAPDEPWDLGHNDSDRTRYTGPEHARCNRSAGGRAAHDEGVRHG